MHALQTSNAQTPYWKTIARQILTHARSSIWHVYGIDCIDIGSCYIRSLNVHNDWNAYCLAHKLRNSYRSLIVVTESPKMCIAYVRMCIYNIVL